MEHLTNWNVHASHTTDNYCIMHVINNTGLHMKLIILLIEVHWLAFTNSGVEPND